MPDYVQVMIDEDTGAHYGRRAGSDAWEPIGQIQAQAAARLPGMRAAAARDQATSSSRNSLMRGIREMTLPGDPDKPIGQSLAEWGENAVHDPMTYAPLASVPMQIITEGQKAWEEAKAGNYTAAAAHTMRAAVPVAGPMIGTIAENIGSGEGRRAAGNVAGIVGQALLAKGAGAAKASLATRAAARAAGTGAEAAEVAESGTGQSRGPLEPPPEDVSPLSPPPSARPAKLPKNEAAYADAVDQHKAALAKDVETLRQTVDRASPKVRPGIEEAEAGSNAGIALAARKAHAQAAFRQLDAETENFVVTDPKTGLVEGPVQPRKLIEEARNITQELTDRSARYWTTDSEGNAITAAMRSDLVNSVQGTLDRVANLQRSMTVQQAQELRTTLGEEVRSVSDVLPTRVQRVLSRLESAIDDDVESSLTRMARDKAIDPETLAAAREARGTWRDLHQPFIRRLTQLSESNPERVYQEMWSPRTSVEDLALAKRVLPPDAYDTLQFHALRDKIVRPFVRNATFAPDAQSAIAGSRSTFQQLTSPEKLLDLVEAPDDPRFRAKLRFMVGPELSNEIAQVAKTSAERPTPQWSQGSSIGMIVKAAARMTGLVHGPALHIGTAALEYGVSKLLTSPAARPQLGRLASLASKGASSAEAIALASALGAQARNYAEEHENHGDNRGNAGNHGIKPPP